MANQESPLKWHTCVEGGVQSLTRAILIVSKLSRRGRELCHWPKRVAPQLDGRSIHFYRGRMIADSSKRFILRIHAGWLTTVKAINSGERRTLYYSCCCEGRCLPVVHMLCIYINTRHVIALVSYSFS